MPHLLEAIEFSDPVRARREISFLAEDLDPDVLNQVESLLTACPDPERALLCLVSLKQQNPGLLPRLAQSPGTLHKIIAVFSYSRFLADEILKNPRWIQEMEPLEHLISSERYAELLAEFLPVQTPAASAALSLALFRRKQILRTLLRDVLGLTTLGEVTAELSNIADSILEISYRRIRADLVARHGRPLYRDSEGGVHECGMSVIALGKLGGQELNYSSDIDLMFVYDAAGETEGPASITNKEFFKKVANEYTQLLSTYTAEGLCYRVDLRLRPDGSLGEACISLDGAKQYYQTRGRDWELQMLIKARVAAGERQAGQDLLDSLEARIYSTTLDFSAVELVSATRERISEKLVRKRGARAAFDVKLARGGIRDIEFLVQCLQRLHGGRVPWVRHAGTMLALSRLNDKDLLSAAEYARLVSAYRFLRNLEHRLQFEDDRQTHVLPADPAALDLLARKMPSAHLGSAPSGEKLLQELNAHLESVQEIYERVIHAQKPMYYTEAPAGSVDAGGDVLVETNIPNLVRFLDQKAPGLATVLAQSAPRFGAVAFEHFLEKVLPHPGWLGLLDDQPATARHAIDIFEHSPYFADELIRTPELIEDVAGLGPGAPPFLQVLPLLQDPSDLRRFFRREMFRIQISSLCLGEPVFQTLAHTSDLADASIA
ncbi:MAG: hypothetical protein JO022_04725, partial [Acidobacteriaceae bacterium]|nr:hypothetical protein [Acidobacteriaceae bacterium]